MNPVYLRLLEIAEDQGQVAPVPNTYFQELLGLSSGRIAQIRDPQSIAKIGPKGLGNLAMLGYNPKWVNFGSPNKKHLPQHQPASEQQAPMARDVTGEYNAGSPPQETPTIVQQIAALVAELPEQEQQTVLSMVLLVSRGEHNKHTPEAKLANQIAHGWGMEFGGKGKRPAKKTG